ncbi:MAG TPA: hypothetical protein VLA92_02210 [Candidatus Saccharimonadales bacterium]|nr:hypothetical protein [Candidatus Saccharimonadales bacterium]
MAFRHHKVPKKIAPITKKIPEPVKQADDNLPKDLPMQADVLLHDMNNVKLFEDVLNQINAYYEKAWNNGKEILPVFVGITHGGLMVELSAIRDKGDSDRPVNGSDLNVFTYQLGTDLKRDIEPREIAEANMVKGQEQIRLHSETSPMPSPSDGKAMAKWRFIDAETIQLQTMGIFEIQPENYKDQVSYGRGIKALGGDEEEIIPIQHFAAELV